MFGIPSWAWMVWAALSVGSFLILEFAALANTRENDTLSENLRRWLGLDPPRPVRKILAPLFIAGLVGFVVWFVPHILWSLW
ncbi:hypothetical protein [Nonomuraea sp. NPDC049504]|uniref:hypothetical protein n=1 Tax=Nonomuraea sp. NPDC049504 TaxID=3154729 RepID=UPI00342356D2